MSCVNKSSKEFKDLASKHGISANALELITHKYWLEIGSEENFPTDVYIQAQLGNNSYQENITSVRKLWDESYSSPKEYNSFEEVDKAYNEALKYFPKGAVVYYKNDKGRYILSVRKPVEKTPATAYDFFSDEYNSAKKLNLQINEGENYTIDKVEELFNKFNTDRTSQFLADKVFKLAKDLGLQISFNSSLPAAGRYTNNNTIVYNKRYFEADLNNDRKPDILLHEVIHAITMYALSDQTANWSRSKDLEDFRNTINDIYGKVRYNDALKGERGIKDIKEFVAELGNPIFRRKLQSIDNRSFWQKIVDAVKNLLGIHTSSTYYGRMINTLDKAINAFDIDSYMKYNGIKQSLQRGYNDHRVETKDMTEVELKSTVKNAITDSAPKMKENGTKVSVLSDADRSALSYVDTMSKDELSKEVGLIKQEYSDYDILNAMRGIEPSKKGKHTFTFNDGTTVNVPFKPNEQQAHALNVMDEFIKSDETSMTLSGYAGTGKTSLMEILAKKATKDGVPIKFSASTNKAAAVLKSKVSKIGYTADTLNKVFGISVEVDSSKPYDAKNLVTKLKDAQVWWGTTVIIDEASMINEKNYKILTDIAKENGLKIIFVGDKAQLAPVKENKISPVFRSTNTKCVELTKVERTDDNAILKEATNLRNNQPLSMESSFNDEGKGVAFTKDNQTASDVIKYYVGQLKNNPDSFKILAYTNAAVANYNERVRRLLGYQGETPNVGEPMMGYANWGYDYHRKTYQFINSEAYTVTKVDAPKQVSFNIQENNVKLTIIPITLKDSLGESRTFNYIDIKGNAANRETVAFLGALKNKSWAKAMSVPKYARRPYYNTVNQIEQYLFVNDDIKEGGRTLVAKVIDFGYAMTVHKSQGSTFTNVLMDENDISKARNAVEESFNPVATVDLGNAGHEVTSNDHLDSVDEIDLGEDFSNVKQKPTNTDTANMFQQLNYVAMSRATNTVTVLTDGAKKEDSPLNHIKEKGAEKPVQETQRPVAPVTPEKPREYYTGNIAPDAETIFVFGSNPEGRHGAGAAKIAHDEFGAQYGVGEGLTGNAYALPTKDLRVRENKGLKSISPERITESIKKMYAVARQHPDKLFKVAYRNTSNASLNGYTGYEMIDMFNKAGKVPSNVQFSEEWYKTGLLKPIETTQSTTSKDKFIVNESVFGDNINKTKLLTFYSGGAKGSDTYWGNATNRIGGKTIHYRPTDYDKLSKENKDRIEKEYNEVISYLGKHPSNATGYIGKLLRRDLLQADSASAIFAVGHLDNNGLVAGGTGYATTRGIIRGIPVHLYNQETKSWMIWDANQKKFVNEPQPTLVNNAALIGTRGLNTDGQKAIDDVINAYQEAINDKGTRSYNSILNITQNASGRLGSLDKTDEDSFNSAKETLRKADATPKEIEEATKTLNDIYERKNKEIQTIFKDVSDLTGAKFSIVEAAGSWKGGGEYSFKIKVEAPTKEAYDNTMLAVSYVAEAARQDAFVENLGEADRKDISQNSLLEGQQTPNITIPFSHSLSEREMALVQGTFLENSTDELPLDATITKDEISFNLPAWVLEDTDENGEKKDNATRYKEYKELYDKWNNKIIEIFNNNKDGRLKGIYRQEAKRTYQKNRLQGCDSYGEGEKTRTYNDYRNNLLSGQRGNGTNANQSKGVGRQATLTDEEGQVIKANAEKLFGLEEDNIQPTIEGIPSTDDAPSTSHTLSLPGYKYFNDLQEDTTVDASWKDDLLKELDNQLSTDNTTEQNNEIINKMNDILKASTEDDLKGEQSSKKQAEIQHDLDEYDKLNKQFDNLLEGNFADKENGNIKDLDIKFKASEIRHVAELVGNYLSDIITKLQTEPDAASELFDELQFDRRVDFTTMTRREIASTIGINNIIARAKHDFAPENGVLPYDNVDTLAKAQLVEENWDALMLLASDVFALNEGFGIKRDYEHSSFEINNEDNQIAYDDFNGYQDEDSTNETEGDSQEKWQIDSMTIDVLNSMSALVRQRLHNCFILDENGERQVDKDWKLPLRVNPRKATNSILRWVQGSTSLDDVVNKLDAKQKDNPWVQQLVQSLSDKTGKETDFQSQFYGVFCKHFQPYSIVLLDKGKYGSIPVNNHPALTEAMNSIVATYRIGEHPLFNINGKINESLLGNENTTNEKADFNLNQAFANLKTIVARLNHKEEFDADMSKEATKWITGVYRVLGYNVTEDMVSDILDADKVRYLTDKLRYIVDDLGRALKQQKKNVGNPKAKKYQPFTYGAEYNVRGSISNFLSPITESLEDTAISAFYDSGKMYQSYVTPSFMTKLMIKFKNLKGQDFEDFIMSEYGNSEWFRDPKSGLIIGKGWKNEMLRLLATDENTRNIFDFKVELNFNKHNYMRNMSDSEYTLSLITEYFSESSETNNLTPAYFRMPMQSNKPSSEFFKFYSYRGSEYKNAIVRNLYTMFLQELGRIQTVRMRNLSKDDPRFIKNFDSNGRKFNFLPFLNTYLEDTNISARTLLRDEDGRVSTDNERLAKLLQRKIEGLEETKLTAEEETELKSLVTKAIRNYMEARANEILDRWESSGIVEAARNIKNIVPHEDLLKTDKDENKNEYVRQSLENYIWNDYLATKNILQLTVGDTAFYKDAEDLQKRLAQLHAPGIRGNINATDYEGHRVSDGKYRTLVLRDFDNFISSIIDNISEVFDRMIERAPENQKNQWRALKESLVGEHGEYRKINVTDAQGYSSPSSYRKKAFIFGKWSRHAEDIYQKLLKGEYTFSDLKTAFQPLKPFVYTHLEKNLGVDNAPIHTMHVPFQAKNSEYLLIMADALIKGEQMKSGNLSRPNLLSAIYRVMEDSEKINPTKGIDTVQFESAIKSGLQGALDIHQFSDTKGGEDAAYTFMMNQVYKMDDKGQRTNEYNTDTFVHEASYDDYCLQQEVPEHFKNHSQAHGSQIRAITPSDLDEYKDPNADHNDENNIVYYEWTEPDGTKRRVTASEFRKEYEDTIAANIEQDLNKLYEEFHLNSQDKRERNIALSKVLQREILSSPRYGVDLLQACSVDKTTGEFRIPKGDPIQAKRIEQLINSIIKNRVNKQKIAGGPIVQVTNFGTSKQLHIRFNDRQGGLLKTKEEFNADDSLKKEYGNYSKYTKERQAGIAYFEVYIPMWSDELYNKFVDENGNIDVDAIEATSPELLKMISYRIPTEDKYSTAPMKAVGFMPREAGDAIMLPYELTTIDDSDFDVDKRYVMRKDLQIVSKPKGQIFKEMFNQVVESYKSSHDGKIDSDHKTALSDLVNTFIDDRNRGKYKNAVINFMGHPVKADSIMNYLNSIYRKVAYTVKMPTDRQYRDNKIIDMTWAVLTNEMTADKILNPGGFEKVAKTGYKIAAYKAVGKEGKSWNSLQGMTEDELKDLSYTSKDLSWVDTQIQFYKQNSATSSMIGIFAVNKVAHAILESDDIYIDVNEICGKEPFTIADTTFDGRMRIDSKLDSEGNLIGKTEGSLVSASADGVKKPVLDLMNVNTTTANVLNTLLRMGMPFDDAALFMSQDSITRLLREYNNRSLTNYVSLQSVINEFMDEFDKENHITDDSNIKTEELSRQELIEGLLDTDHKVIDYKVMLALQKLLALGQALRNPTFATRFNSISSAVGPLIIDNLIMQHKIDQFKDSATEEGTHFYDKDGFNVDIDDVFYNHPILKQFAKTLDVANELFKDMPAGSEQFKNVLDNLPEYISDKIYNDKKLLSQLSDFYQSYLLVASGLVDSSQLKDIINNFPKEFNDKNYKEKYKDNELIQAIKLNVSRKTNRPYLEIKTTGMDAPDKEALSSAWIDLHREDPELSKKLFIYNFFRGGIGFSPKTFMPLVPMFVKEHMNTTKADGSTISYLDTFRNMPDVNPDIVIDQFIRNNWDNNKLVPWKGGKGTKYVFDYKNGLLTVNKSDLSGLEGAKYIKTKGNGRTNLWRLISSDENGAKYQLIKPLGDNNEYIEMSTSEIDKPISETLNVEEDNNPSSLSEKGSTEDSTDKVKDVKTDKDNEYSMSNLADLIMKQNPRFDKNEAVDKIEDIKKDIKSYRKFLINVFKHKGLNLNENQAMEEFNKYC